MAVKLVIDDPKKDQLVPVKALKEFGVALQRETIMKDSFMEKMFKSEEKRKGKKEKIKAIADAINKIGGAADGKRAWFAKFFLAPFEGKASKEAKELFEAISKTDGFEALQTATTEYNKTFKANTDATATAAAKLTSVLEKTLTPATAQFAEAYKAQTQQPAAATPAAQPVAPANAAPAAGGGGTAPVTAGGAASLGESSIVDRFKMDKKLYEAGLIERSEYLASLAEAKKTLLEVSRQIQAAVDAALKQAQEKNVAINTVQDLQAYMKKVPEARGITLAKTYTDQILNAAKQRAGYTIGTAPAGGPPAPKTDAPAGGSPAGGPQPTPQAPAPAAPDPILSGLSTLTGQNKPEEGELVKLAKDSASFQQVMTDLGKTVITEALTPKQKQLVKLNLQKQVLAEYIKTGEMATKTQLNEFFLMALLLAALAAAAGWAIKTLGPMLAKSLTGTEPSGRSRPNDSTKDSSDIAAALAAGYSPNGQMTDINGQTVPDIAEAIQKFSATLADKSKIITEAVATIKQSVGQKQMPPTYGPFDQAFAQSPANEINALNAALEKLNAY
jgi:hypothetical protein